MLPALLPTLLLVLLLPAEEEASPPPTLEELRTGMEEAEEEEGRASGGERRWERTFKFDAKPGSEHCKCRKELHGACPRMKLKLILF